MDILRHVAHDGEMGHSGTVTAIIVPLLARAARAFGVDPGPILARLGLSEQVSYEDRIPITRLFDLWETLVRRTGEPALAARAVHYPVVEERSLLSFLCSVQEDVGGAIRALDRYWPTVSDAYRWTVERRGNTVSLLVPAAPSTRSGWRSHVEYDAIDIVRTCSRMTGGEARPLAVSFAHRAPPVLHFHRDALGLEPRFAAERTEIVYPRSVADIRLASAKPALARTLAAQLDAMLARLSARDTTARAARDLIPAMLRAGGATAERVARRLGAGRRTLERRLAAEGTSFRALIDEARHRLAVEWLSDVPIAEVAQRLGYSDVRAFDRAFKRWTRTTPSAWRARRPAARSSSGRAATLRRAARWR
jgi:AraC-like DNA-binding protein